MPGVPLMALLRSRNDDSNAVDYICRADSPSMGNESHCCNGTRLFGIYAIEVADHAENPGFRRAVFR